MSHESIVEFINGLLIDQGYIEAKVSASANLKDDIGLDSVGVFTVIDELEDEYDIFLDSNDMAEPPITLSDLARLIHQKISASES